jgi:hypothetical protein
MMMFGFKFGFGTNSQAGEADSVIVASASPFTDGFSANRVIPQLALYEYEFILR